MPSVKATAAAPAQPRISRKGTTDALQTCRATLWAFAHSRDALPAGGATLGRPDRLRPRSGPQLATDGVRVPWTDDRGVGRAALAVPAEPRRSLRRRGRQARR